MSWSLDPRRPNPTRDPEGWYKFWQEELEWSFSRHWERLVKDSDTKVFDEETLLHLQHLREEIASHRQDISRDYLASYSEGKSVEKLWEEKGVDGRERILVQALVEIASICKNEDSWQYCPDINKQTLCFGKGEGLIDLLKHFLIKDVVGKPSLDFPILKEPRVWRLFDIKDEVSNASRPASVRAQHQMVVVCRHHFLVRVLFFVLASLYGDKVQFQWIKGPKLSKDQIKMRSDAARAEGHLPTHVYDAIDKCMKDQKKLRKTRDLLDKCANCGKQSLASSTERMMCCGGCKKLGREVTYCSRECQKHHYRDGKPPHKLTCSKPLPIEPIFVTTSEPGPFPLYTESPTPDLRLQTYLLQRDNQEHDYYLVLQKGKLLFRDYHQNRPKLIFLEARRRAMAERDKSSIGIMHFMLGPEFTSQLEREYEVKMEECIEAAKEHKDWNEIKVDGGRSLIPSYSKCRRLRSTTMAASDTTWFYIGCIPQAQALVC